MQCKNCGGELIPNAAFCSNCGNKIDAEQLGNYEVATPESAVEPATEPATAPIAEPVAQPTVAPEDKPLEAPAGNPAAALLSKSFAAAKDKGAPKIKVPQVGAIGMKKKIIAIAIAIIAVLAIAISSCSSSASDSDVVGRWEAVGVSVTGVYNVTYGYAPGNYIDIDEDGFAAYHLSDGSTYDGEWSRKSNLSTNPGTDGWVLNLDFLTYEAWLEDDGRLWLVETSGEDLVAVFEQGYSSGSSYSSSSSSSYGSSSSSSSSGYSSSSSSSSYYSSATVGERNALESALSYLSFTSFSYTGLIDQLEYEGFSTSEATYAADNCGANWYEQAADSAAAYMNIGSFSRSRMIDQLEYEGFTYDQACYGADSVGL